MTVFPFHTTPFTKPLIAIISCHGLTDLDSKQFVLPYATVLSVPLPSAAITALFCAASLYHFSEDVGIRGSIYLHLSALFIGVAFGVQAAFLVMIAYMGLVHTPFHYLRCSLNSRATAAKAAFFIGILAAILATTLDNHTTIELSDFHQRIATAHIWCEYVLKRR